MDVRRAKDDVKLDAAVYDNLGVALRKRRHRSPRAEQPSVEEVRAGAAGLERERTEAQHLHLEAHLDETPLERLELKLDWGLSTCLCSTQTRVRCSMGPAPNGPEGVWVRGFVVRTNSGWCVCVSWYI